jgi:hypothetical protein
MGRPPIGKRAMTATERQRRWRAKSRSSKSVLKPAAKTADQAALIAAMGKLLLAMSQKPTGRSKRSGFEAAVREFRAVVARLQDPAGRPKDKGPDERRFKLTVTGYGRRMFWLTDPDSDEVIGPLVLAPRAKARRRKAH